MFAIVFLCLYKTIVVQRNKIFYFTRRNYVKKGTSIKLSDDCAEHFAATTPKNCLPLIKRPLQSWPHNQQFEILAP